MTHQDAMLADAIRRYRERLLRTGDVEFAADAAPEPPEHITVVSDGNGNVVMFRDEEPFHVREGHE